MNFGAAFALAYYALVRLHAGLGQTLLALVPLATLLLAVAQGQERLRLAAVIGTLLALAGVAVISQGPLARRCRWARCWPRWPARSASPRRRCWCAGSPPVHPVTMNAVGMTTGAVLLVAGSVLAGEPHPLPQRATTWAAVAYLVVVGSVVVFVLYLVVLRYWAASRAAYAFVLIPFVTVLLSAWLDNEPLGARTAAGWAARPGRRVRRRTASTDRRPRPAGSPLPADDQQHP